MIKKTFIIYAMIWLLAMNSGYCQDKIDNKLVKTVSGTVERLDWVASLMNIRYFDSTRNNYDEIIVYVADTTKIYLGTGTVSLSDIEEGDEVTVEYYSDYFNGFKALSIVDENQAKE